ncbi:hypothetical protein MUK42_28785 [Musa troglodytarum]|uniref:Uncharacterized protein n=1 Tax=Musa troglodytarum TaxID=320322 RepID=A0A9E7F4P4_9LILI|nr:hypothetical protein MUK42_28785 [Musa troglodytarum]
MRQITDVSTSSCLCLLYQTLAGYMVRYRSWSKRIFSPEFAESAPGDKNESYQLGSQSWVHLLLQQLATIPHGSRNAISLKEILACELEVCQWATCILLELKTPSTSFPGQKPSGSG